MLTWMLLHDTVTSWVELHDWVWFLAFAVNLTAVASFFASRLRSRPTARELEAQVKLSERILAEIAFEEKLLKAARSFHFGMFRVEWCGDERVNHTPRYCVKHARQQSTRYRLDGTTEWEPSPSNREDDFIERTAFERDIAVGLALWLDAQNDEQAAAERAAGEEDT